MPKKQFTHIDDAGNPKMVDVSAKAVTRRTARAQAVITVGSAILKQIKNNELITKKGPVFQTAIIAGVMGAKKTSELIPFCHPLGLEDCQVKITTAKNNIVITTEATVTAKTGVEMEALTAASVAALTVYDMCKALSHDMVIGEVQLLEKTGGKKDFRR
ncbi:cyclic pyranopterin monophosphate synthase MoaC [Fulvivirgaceae bacterium PWU5]|uniref:cyclic pyranopterin monophosphate synthase n=1 Tax=Dawidia cretensis TaxID=2782350 RepID=A0AAP2GUL2_9BACT|nr:cyclic pyranopterin monophosphate synthase MoaC [Dawidia cretensis]MBT1707682.1 cyclic pyranopterin monophosphate synthase MoaC [Dawidia cretensis]